MKSIFYNSNSRSGNYVPPPIGNGELVMGIDMEGIQRQALRCKETPMIYWAGRRFFNLERHPLIPFGYLEHDIVEAPVEWTQSLDVESGLAEAKCHYKERGDVTSEAFVHLERPLLAIRKSFSGSYSLKYVLAKPASEAQPDLLRLSASCNAHGIDIAYEVEGYPSQRGLICLFCDEPVKASIEGNKFTLTAESSPASFFVAFIDSLESSDFVKSAAEIKALALQLGFDGLFASSKAAWSRYWQESYLEIPDSKEGEVYAVSQYHLRISSTRWSMPAGGVNGWHWNGAYYSFDEHFTFMGLASSGHFDIARRIPEFRFNTLKKAQLRSFQHWGEENSAKFGARFHFMSDENGDEITPPGYWLEHIFQMAQVALSAWEFHRFSGDIEFLRQKGYPLISECADFFHTQTLYEVDGGRLIVGKCTDLERLGPARENAFMTSCGVIATFQAAADAADALGVDSEKAKLLRSLAKRLLESLPSKDGRYEPYPNCPKKSIAVFAGTFPYGVLQPDDPRQMAAIQDFIASEDSYGNMYPVGKSVCSWYSAWKGIAFGRLGKPELARECVRQICAESNGFSEIFEINEPPMCPWFCTAEGSFVQLMNECLVRSSGSEIEMPSYPAKSLAFKLAATGGVMVEASFENGACKSLKLEARHACARTLRLPDGRQFDIKLGANSSTILI